MRPCSICGIENPDDSRYCRGCGARLDPVDGVEARKVVTVVFCDVVDSTGLGETIDPERLRALLARYFDRMRVILEGHGGTVEKFIGDAVMAVFGVPVVHEDDALRAVRAAIEMRDALPELGLQGRIGVMTGEVVTGTAERLATGDAVNVAARLESAAAPGEVLIGEPTLALVRPSVEVEPIESLELKGKAERVAAYRVWRVSDAPDRPHDTPFTGRAREVASVHEAWGRAVAGPGCELITIVGEPGVGKSRLVAEALASLPARVVRGRCLPYGDGITYWPVVEVLKQLALLPDDEAAADAIRSLLGERTTRSSPEEIAWAFRKTLESAAAEQALVVVFDDIQWAEGLLLDLIEHVGLLSTGVALLIVCMARPELVDERPSWPVTIRLEPLADEAVDDLLPRSLARDLRGRIARAAGGNPLFIQEMLAMVGDAETDLVVPPTLQALLAARLDQLESTERGVLERAAVEGEVFHRGAVQALMTDDASVTPHLAALVRKGLIRPDRAIVAGEDGFRFRHLLFRDSAYEALPKSRRAELHDGYATWLDGRAGDLVERDEVVGYHLETASGYREELGLPRDPRLAARAHRHLAEAGSRAERRQDYNAAAGLYQRASALLPVGEVDLIFEKHLASALYWVGKTDIVVERRERQAAQAAAAGDDILELCCRVQLETLRTDAAEDGAADRLAALLERAFPTFRSLDDDLALHLAYEGLASVEQHRGLHGPTLEALEQSEVHALRIGERTSLDVGFRAGLMFFGSTPASELLTWLDEQHASPDDFFVRAFRANALGMLGRFDEARAILVRSRAELAARGTSVLLANLTTGESVWLELWAGDPSAALELNSEGLRLYEELGAEGGVVYASGLRARIQYLLGRLDEAEANATRVAEDGARGDYEGETTWRCVRGKVLARRGAYDDAELLVSEAVEIAERTDALDKQGDAHADLAEVLLLAGNRRAAADELEIALQRYELKENLASAARIRKRLAEL